MTQAEATTIKIKERIDSFRSFREEKLTARRLARQYDIPPNTLNAVFKRLFNDTPRSYILKYVMNKAAMYLEKQYSVGETMLKVGYFSRDSFRRSFKNEYGLSPKAYRYTKKLEQCKTRKKA